MSTRSFCPLILYHDQPSHGLTINLNSKRKENRSAIGRHLERTHEMLLQNTQYWVDNEEVDSIRVSPSTSTTSNISSSSSSSGDSITTIDNCFRQNNLPDVCPSASESSKRKRRGNLPKEVTDYLRGWLLQHKRHPYPAEKEKHDLANHTGLTVNQISNWFINARRRILQPMLESEHVCAQMMAYPDLTIHDPRRRRLDFYPYPDYKHHHTDESNLIIYNESLLR